jgi:peptidoglycan/xylan/chitin deacetylase (PgdA/CDA1 family)
MASDGRRKLNGLVKLWISLFFFAGSCILRMLLYLIGRKPAATCIVLYYHSVPAEQRQAFARQMDLVGRFTKPIRVDRAPEMLPGERYSGITFDDAFENVIDNAVPELVQRNIPAAIFVTVEVLGKHADWWPDAAPERHEKIAVERQIYELPADLISLGSHTLTHPRLTLSSETEAKKEIFESRRKLQALLSRKVATFSFPFGACNDELVGWCREAGYERVFTSLPTGAFKYWDEFVTGRVKAEPTDLPIETYLKLLGCYRWIPLAISIKQRLFTGPTLSNAHMGTPDVGKSIALS